MPLTNLGPPNRARDPFYSANDPRRDQDFDWPGTPVIGGPAGYLEQNQDAAYTRWMGKMGMGLGDESPFGRYLADQFRKAQLGHRALLAENPTLTFQDYLNTLGGQQAFRNRFSTLSPYARGVRSQGPSRVIADI